MGGLETLQFRQKNPDSVTRSSYSNFCGCISTIFPTVRNFGWEAWTRTRIARFRVWSPTNWTTSQKLKTKQLTVELHDLWAEDPILSLLDPLKQISHREPTSYRELSIQSTRGRVFHQPLRPRAVEARWNGWELGHFRLELFLQNLFWRIL